jgi:hypothetical protein
MTTWYVSLDGSDANNGISETTAFLTIAMAVSLSLPGDKIILLPGIYSSEGNTRLYILGNSQNFITIEGSGEVYIDTGGTCDIGDIYVFNSHYAYIKNINFIGIPMMGSTYSTIDNCTFSPNCMLLYRSQSCQVINCKNVDSIITSCTNCSISNCSGALKIRNDLNTPQDQLSCKLKQFTGTVDIKDSYCNIIYSNINHLVLSNSIGTIINQCVFMGSILHEESSETLITQNRFISSNDGVYITISDSVNYSNNVHIVNNLFSDSIAVKYNGTKGATNIAVNYNNILVSEKITSVLIDFSSSTRTSNGMLWNNVLTGNKKIAVGKSSITQKTNSSNLYPAVPTNDDPASFYVSNSSLVGKATLDNLTNSDYYGQSHSSPPDIGAFNQK